MKYCVSLIFSFFFAGVVLAQPDPDFIDKIARSEGECLFQKSSFTENSIHSTNDIIYQRMEWYIDPAISYISGSVTSWFISLFDQPGQIGFDLHEAMGIDSILHQNEKMDFMREGNFVTVSLPYNFKKGDLDSLTFFYRGNPANSGFGAFSAGIHNDVPVIWTLSEPYGAMEWWPCKQSLNDKIDSIDIIVTCPEQYRTASNGILASEKVEKQLRTMHWKHRFPIATYLVAIAVTNYEYYSDFLSLDNGDSIQILNYVYPENLENAKTKTGVTAQVMELYNELIGVYPFAAEKYGHAQIGWRGGMEHQTMSFMYNFGYELIAHELAHQWFGDYITLGSWQDIWLNEGFATYLTGLSYEYLLDGVWWPIWKKLNINSIISEPGGSVFVSDTTEVSRIFSGRLSYSKGAYLLHMLRWILRDEHFFQAVRNYFHDQEVANGFARTDQLVKHFEESGDTVLTGFFNDWFYGEGYPIYTMHYSQSANGELLIRLSQVSAHESQQFFELPVPVRAYSFDGKDSADFRLSNTVNNQEFITKPGFQVADIKIDPDNWLVLKTDEILKVPKTSNGSDVVFYPNPVTDRLNIFAPALSLPYSVMIFSQDGKLILNRILNTSSVNLSGLSPGTYIITLEASGKTYRKEIIRK